jgi:hypothetical protein
MTRGVVYIFVDVCCTKGDMLLHSLWCKIGVMQF